MQLYAKINDRHLFRTISFTFQDYSKFLDENFDVKDWVNAAFRQQKEGTNDVCRISFYTFLNILIVGTIVTCNTLRARKMRPSI